MLLFLTAAARQQHQYDDSNNRADVEFHRHSFSFHARHRIGSAFLDAGKGVRLFRERWSARRILLCCALVRCVSAFRLLCRFVLVVIAHKMVSDCYVAEKFSTPRAYFDIRHP